MSKSDSSLLPTAIGRSITIFIYSLFLLLITLLVLSDTRQKNIDHQKDNPVNSRQTNSNTFGKIPLFFERNQGQTHEDVTFLSRGSGYTLFLTQKEAVFGLTTNRPAVNLSTEKPGIHTATNSIMSMQFMHANPEPEITGLNQLPGKSNYFKGNDPGHWTTDVPHFARVQYENIYPGTDLVFYGNQGQLEFDFIVAPGASYHIIQFAIRGADDIAIDHKGQLCLSSGGENVVFKRPHIYQVDKNHKNRIEGDYCLDGDIVSFEIADYNPHLALMIDPVLLFSTYLGGSDYDRGEGIAVDADGNIYVTGNSKSTDFPTLNAYQNGPAGDDGGYLYDDVIVAKIKGDGSELIYSTYIGGTSADYGKSIAVDDLGNVYVTGNTSSEDDPGTSASEGFPTVNGFQNDSNDYNTNPFVLKLGAGGNNLLYSSYFGKDYSDQKGTDIAIDAARNCYILGTTFYGGIETRNAYMAESPGYYFQYFVAKFNPDLSGDASLIYSTYLGGNDDSGWTWDTGAIAVTPDGSAVVTGRTQADDYPIQNAVQSTKKGSQDAILTKLSPDGGSVVFSTFLGGNDKDEGTDVCVDADGNIYVTGWASEGFPQTEKAYQYKSWSNFVCKFTPSGTLVYAGRAGSIGEMDIDDKGNVYVLEFPENFQTNVDPVHILKLTENGDGLESSSPVSGTTTLENIWRPTDMAVTTEGTVHLIGNTSDGTFETRNAIQSQFNGGTDLFIVKLGQSMDFYPDGVAYDPGNWDKNVGELQSLFTDLRVTGKGLGNISEIVFKLNGTNDVYVEAQNIQSYDDSVTFNLAVIHAAEVGERELILKKQDGTEIDVTKQSGKQFIISRVRTYYNQAVDQNLVDSPDHQEILIANKRGMVRLVPDDHNQINHTFTGTLVIKGIPGDSTSIAPFEYRDSYTEQEIIQARDYMFIPFPGPPGQGEHTMTVNLQRDDGRIIRCPDIKRTFIKTAPINILVLRYNLAFVNGNPLARHVTSVSAADVINAVDYVKKVYPVSEDQVRLRDMGDLSLLPQFYTKSVRAGTGEIVVLRDIDVVIDLLLYLDRYLDAANDILGEENNVIVAFLPGASLYRDNNNDGDVQDPEDPRVTGCTLEGTRALLVTPTRDPAGRPLNLGGTLAHELGHRILDIAIESADWLPIDGANLGDEYQGGAFSCDVNPPVLGNTGREGIVCENSPYLAGIAGDNTAIYTDRSAFDPWLARPELTYLGSNHSSFTFNFMGNSRPDSLGWISLRCYDEIMKSLVPKSSGSLQKMTSPVPILKISGMIHRNGTGTLFPLVETETGVPSLPSSGPYTIAIQNRMGSNLSTHDFDIPYIFHANPPESVEEMAFSVRLEKTAGAHKVVLKKDNTVLAEQTLSENPPVIDITAPNAGDMIGKQSTISWTASDPDDDTLIFSVLYEMGDQQIIQLASNLSSTSYILDTELFEHAPGTITVMATDGYNRTYDSVGNISVSVSNIHEMETPRDFKLGQNYPNPFNAKTKIKYSIPKTGQSKATLYIFNTLGTRVRTLVDKPHNPGTYDVHWDGKNDKGSDLPSGVYFYSLHVGSIVETKKMILLR